MLFELCWKFFFVLKYLMTNEFFFSLHLRWSFWLQFRIESSIYWEKNHQNQHTNCWNVQNLPIHISILNNFHQNSLSLRTSNLNICHFKTHFNWKTFVTSIFNLTHNIQLNSVFSAFKRELICGKKKANSKSFSYDFQLIIAARKTTSAKRGKRKTSLMRYVNETVNSCNCSFCL